MHTRTTPFASFVRYPLHLSLGFIIRVIQIQRLRLESTYREKREQLVHACVQMARECARANLANRKLKTARLFDVLTCQTILGPSANFLILQIKSLGFSLSLTPSLSLARSLMSVCLPTLQLLVRGSGFRGVSKRAFDSFGFLFLLRRKNSSRCFLEARSS